MTREHWKELLPFVTAFANGERVQLITCDGFIECDTLTFDCSPSDYRIAPKSEDAEWLRERAKHMDETCPFMAYGNKLRAIADKLERLEGGAE